MRRKAILLIHGFVGGCYDYGELPNDLELVRNFDVYMFTLKGHEKTIVSNVKYTDWIKDCERNVERLINNGYKTIYVIGHSMGGVLATYIASKYQKYVKKLVLVAPAFKYFCFNDDKLDIMRSIKKSPEILKSLPQDEVLSRLIKTPIPTVVEFTTLVKKYSKYTKDITCPTLTIHGTSDLLVPIDSTDYVTSSIKSKTNIYVNIEKVNHNCFTGENKELVNTTILDFLCHHQKKEITNVTLGK
mgnify:CR=1 FL=1